MTPESLKYLCFKRVLEDEILCDKFAVQLDGLHHRNPLFYSFRQLAAEFELEDSMAIDLPNKMLEMNSRINRNDFNDTIEDNIDRLEWAITHYDRHYIRISYYYAYTPLIFVREQYCKKCIFALYRLKSKLAGNYLLKHGIHEIYHVCEIKYVLACDAEDICGEYFCKICASPLYELEISKHCFRRTITEEIPVKRISNLIYSLLF